MKFNIDKLLPIHKHNIVLGNSIYVLKKIPKETIDLVVTSPPYKNVDGFYPELIDLVFNQIWRVLKNNSLIFVNFGHLAGQKLRPFEVAKIITEVGGGFKLEETFTWVKNHYRPISGTKRVNNLTEFIFMFSKGTIINLDRLAVGVPYADKDNVSRYGKGKDIKCGGNIWYIPYETINQSEQKLHNDRFPVELPTRCIKLSNIRIRKNPIILDPFSGSATTAIACLDMKVNYLMIESNPIHYQTSIERIKNYTKLD